MQHDAAALAAGRRVDRAAPLEEGVRAEQKMAAGGEEACGD